MVSLRESVLQRLQQLDPSQGERGASIAVDRILEAGDILPMVERFNLPRERLAQLRYPSLTEHEQLTVINCILDSVWDVPDPHKGESNE